MKNLMIVTALILLANTSLYASKTNEAPVKEYSINPVNYSVDLKVDQHQEKLYVLINGTFKNEMVISLINVRGQEAYYDNLKELNKEYKTTIDLSQLGKGLYFFKIDSGDEIRLKKITL